MIGDNLNDTATNLKGMRIWMHVELLCPLTSLQLTTLDTGDM